MKKNDGGPAFPTDIQFDGSGYCANSHAKVSGGMSLRDYFAAKAMQVIIDQTSLNEMTEYTIGAVATNAYLMADAMLKQRNGSA
jgi:hypothetical protein